MPRDLTLIHEMEGMEGIITHVTSWRNGYRDEDEITIDGETYTVAQLKQEHAERVKDKDLDVSW